MPDPVIKVAALMRTTLHKIDGLARVQDAIAEMQNLGVSSLVIERRNADDEYGIVTVRDIAAKVVGANRSVARTSVYEVMTKPALAVAADMNVKYAIRLLSRLGINRALVTRDNELVGLVTLRDLVVGFAERKELPAPGN
ncbi:MAG: CBS domain-containing protein [Paracoccaceae bacterium]|nr:CBS domain-containing protein [Paracoccaceae bacterium]